jgi:hypothetical protein
LVLVDVTGRLRAYTLDALTACRTLGLLIVWENDRASSVPIEGRRGRERSYIGVALIDIASKKIGIAPIGLKMFDAETG